MRGASSYSIWFGSCVLRVQYLTSDSDRIEETTPGPEDPKIKFGATDIRFHTVNQVLMRRQKRPKVAIKSTTSVDNTSGPSNTPKTHRQPQRGTLRCPRTQAQPRATQAAPGVAEVADKDQSWPLGCPIPGTHLTTLSNFRRPVVERERDRTNGEWSAKSVELEPDNPRAI